MKTFQVITDSTSDVEKKYRDLYGIDYIKMMVVMDGNEYFADVDWPILNADEYYMSMRNGAKCSTSISNRLEIETVFRKYLEQGLDIFYCACSNKLSASRNFCESISKELLEEYPERKIICYDSLRACYAEGMIAIELAKMANKGLSVDEALERIKPITLKFQTQCTVGSLEWFRRAGRVKASTAFFGNIIGIKPIICGDAHGYNYAYEKVIGRKKSLDRLIEIVVDRFEESEDSIIHIEHADCLKDANYIKNKLTELINPKEINVCGLGPLIGTTCGPDTIAISFYGKEVTIFEGQNE